MLTLRLQESMSGWMEMNDVQQPEAVEFDVEVTITDRRHPWKAQPFIGTLTLPGRHLTVETHGYITFNPRAPRYDLRMSLPDIGMLAACGEILVDLLNLKESLRVCPMTLFLNGKAVGYMELTRHQPLPVLSPGRLRLVRYAMGE